MTNFSEEDPKKESLSKEWIVYILSCSDGSFYTGITTDIRRRVKEHNAGSASKYTRSRHPVELFWRSGTIKTRSEALRLEYKIKSLSHLEKTQIEINL